MTFKKELIKKIKNLKIFSKNKKKFLGFMIGNTSKMEKGGFYFTPLREMNSMIISGVIVYSEKYAKIAAKYLDGKVDYVLVDAEKKISPKINGKPSNIERRVREILKKSKMWIYKGNDLTVDAIDIFLTNLLQKRIRGIGGKKILIIGAGNIGFKIALQMNERGGKVFLCARNKKKLDLKVKALNLVKSIHTVEKVKAINIKNLIKVVKDLDIIIGATNGKQVVNKELIKQSKKDTVLIDLGKGTFYKEAIELANARNQKIYRVDISVALEGHINKLLMLEKNKDNAFKSKKLHETNLLSTGLLGGYGDIIVDNIEKPKRIFGVCDGHGDFLRKINREQKNKIKKISSIFKIKNEN